MRIFKLRFGDVVKDVVEGVEERGMTTKAGARRAKWWSRSVLSRQLVKKKGISLRA